LKIKLAAIPGRLTLMVNEDLAVRFWAVQKLLDRAGAIAPARSPSDNRPRAICSRSRTQRKRSS